jgi:hypothetical protein
VRSIPGETLALPTRQIAWIGFLRSRQPDLGKCAVGPALWELVAYVLVQEVVGRTLEDKRHLARCPQLPAIRIAHPGGDAQEGALTCAVAAEQGDCLPSIDPEAQSPQRRMGCAGAVVI